MKGDVNYCTGAYVRNTSVVVKEIKKIIKDEWRAATPGKPRRDKNARYTLLGGESRKATPRRTREIPPPAMFNIFGSTPGAPQPRYLDRDLRRSLKRPSPSRITRWTSAGLFQDHPNPGAPDKGGKRLPSMVMADSEIRELLCNARIYWELRVPFRPSPAPAPLPRFTRRRHSRSLASR
jgi:hypothetical protein